MKTLPVSLTNVEVGRRIGVDPSTASLFRNAKRLPSITTLMTIFAEFNVSSAEQKRLMEAVNSKRERTERLAVFGDFMKRSVYSRPSVDA